MRPKKKPGQDKPSPSFVCVNCTSIKNTSPLPTTSNQKKLFPHLCQGWSVWAWDSLVHGIAPLHTSTRRTLPHHPSLPSLKQKWNDFTYFMRVSRCIPLWFGVLVLRGQFSPGPKKIKNLLQWFIVFLNCIYIQQIQQLKVCMSMTLDKWQMSTVA